MEESVYVYTEGLDSLVYYAGSGDVELRRRNECIEEGNRIQVEWVNYLERNHGTLSTDVIHYLEGQLYYHTSRGPENAE